ncbi:MAG: hypothetical protein WC227_00725 [Patescibacteria group bacterium]
MNKRMNTTRIIFFVVAGIVLVYIVIDSVRSLMNDYATKGWFGVLIDLAIAGIGVLAYFIARYFTGKQALTTCGSALRELLGRVYAMMAYLPEGKYPVTLREMNDEDVVFYAYRVIINEEFWTDVPEKITIFASSYVTRPYVMAQHEPFQPKSLIKEYITNAIVLGAEGIPRSKMKKQSQSPLP